MDANPVLCLLAAPAHSTYLLKSENLTLNKKKNKKQKSPQFFCPYLRVDMRQHHVLFWSLCQHGYQVSGGEAVSGCSATPSFITPKIQREKKAICGSRLNVPAERCASATLRLVTLLFYLGRYQTNVHQNRRSAIFIFNVTSQQPRSIFPSALTANKNQKRGDSRL